MSNSTNIGSFWALSRASDIIATTFDGGATWTQRALPLSGEWTGGAYGNGIFVAVSKTVSQTEPTYGYAAATSTDGINWTQRVVPIGCFDIAYGNGTFVVIDGFNGETAASTDGINWTRGENLPSSSGFWASVTYGDGVFVAMNGSGGNSNDAATSTDGINWTQRTLPVSATWSSVTYGNGTFVAVAGNSSNGTTKAATSTDGGVTWTERQLPGSSAHWLSVTYGNGTFVAVAWNSTRAAISNDGVSWTQTTLPVSARWGSVTYDNGVFMTVAINSDIAAVSTDGINWTQRTLPVVAIWISVRPINLSGGKFTVCGSFTVSGGITIEASPLRYTVPNFDPCVRLPPTFDFLPLWWGTGRSLDATKKQYFVYQWKFDNPINLTSIPSNNEWNSIYDTYLDRKTAGWFATTGTRDYGFMMLGQRRMFSADIDFDYSNAGQEVNGSYRTHIVQENQIGETSKATFVGYIENTQLAEASISCSRDFWRGTAGRNTNLIPPPKDFGIAFGTYDNPSNINFGQKTTSQAQVTSSTNSTTTWKTHQRYASTASVKSRMSVLTLANQLGSIVAWYDYKAGDSKPHILRITAFDVNDNVRWAQTLEKSADTGGSFRPEWAPMQEKIGLTHDKQGNIYLTTDWYQPTGVNGYELMTYKIAYGGELLWKKGLSLAADKTFSYSGTLQNIIGHSTEVEDGGNIITAALRPLSAKPYTALMIIKRDTNGNLLNYHSVKIGGQATYYSMGAIYTDRLFIRSPQIVYAGGSAGSFMVIMNSLNMSNTSSHTINNLTTYSGTDNRSGASNKFQPFVIGGTISNTAISFNESWHFFVVNGATTVDNSDLLYTDAFPTTGNHPYTNGSFGPIIAKFTLARSSTNQYPVIVSLPYGTNGGTNFIRKGAYIQIADDEREEYVYWWNQDVTNLSNSNSGVSTGAARPFNIENSKGLNVLVQTDYPAKYVSRTVEARPEWTSVTKNRFKTGPTFKRTTTAFEYFGTGMNAWLQSNWGYYLQNFSNIGVGKSQIRSVIKPYDTDFT